MSRSTVHWICLLGAAVAGVACGGSIGDSGGGGGGDDGTGPGGDGGSGVDPLKPEELACPPKEAIAPTAAPLRRLTSAEYNATVLDLLGDATNPADSFPPEGVVHGFRNNVTTQAVTFDLADDTFKAAEQLATRALAKLDTLVPCNVAQLTEEGCAKAFIDTFGQRAYRRPLSDPEKASYLVTYQKGRVDGGDHKNGIRLAMTRFLASPYFLYRPEWGQAGSGPKAGIVALSPWETATRLSYLLWGSMPDPVLFAAAAADELKTDAQIDAQVERLLADARAKKAVRQFYEGWLLLDKLAKSSKDEKEYPGFGKLVPAMTEEITRFMDDVLWSGTIAQVFTADHTYLNRDLATFLSIDGAATMGTGFDRVTLDPQGAMGPGRRAGILSMPGLLSAQAKPNETSPILRGKFVAEQMLCAEVPLPPANIPPVEAADTSQLTTRQRFEKHAESECASCHQVMDPLGFAFEHFDAAGRFRATEKDQPIDSTGALEGTDVDGLFADGVELSQRLAGSAMVRSCVARQWTRFALGREAEDGDARTLAQLSCGFRGNEARFVDLLAAFTHSDAFRTMATPEGGLQ